MWNFVSCFQIEKMRNTEKVFFYKFFFFIPFSFFDENKISCKISYDFVK